MNLDGTDLIAIGIGSTINTAVYFSLGHLYGNLYKGNTNMAACAFAISNFVLNTFRIMNEIATGGGAKNPTTYYSILAIGEGVIGTIQVLAFRHLNLIGTIGTVVLSTAFYFQLLINLIRINRTYQK